MAFICPSSADPYCDPSAVMSNPSDEYLLMMADESDLPLAHLLADRLREYKVAYDAETV